MNKIAVYVNKNGNTSSLTEEGSIKLYVKENGLWDVKNDIPCSIDFHSGLAKARQSIAEAIHQLTDCKIFVASEVIGQLYYILEANGFTSYEAVGEPSLFLDSILESEMTEANKLENTKEEITSLTPELTEKCGVYFINLKKALALNPTLSSKKILKSFLQAKKFEVLEILCDHIPRWFETDLQPIGLTFTSSKANEKEYNISIKNN